MRKEDDVTGKWRGPIVGLAGTSVLLALGYWFAAAGLAALLVLTALGRVILAGDADLYRAELKKTILVVVALMTFLAGMMVFLALDARYGLAAIALAGLILGALEARRLLRMTRRHDRGTDGDVSSEY